MSEPTYHGGARNLPSQTEPSSRNDATADQRSQAGEPSTIGPADRHSAGHAAAAPAIRFPTSLAQLRSTANCPACLQPTRGSRRCGRCGFPLDDPRGVRIHELSNAAATALGERGELILAVQRQATAAPVTAGTPGRPAPPPLAPSGPAASTALPAFAPPPVPTLVTLPATAEAHPRRGVPGAQILLLVLGVALLSIAAIFYLVYAWLAFGVLAKALSTLAVTVLVIVGASWLRRLQLRIAAEGVAGLGAVLLVLDTWSLPALGVLGLDRLEPELYWGAALLLLAGLFEGWSRLTALRLPGLAAAIVVGPGVGLLASSALGLLPDPPVRFATLTVGAAAGALGYVLVQGGRGEAGTAAPPTPRLAPTAVTAGQSRLQPLASVIVQANERPRDTERAIAGGLGISAAALALPALAPVGLTTPLWSTVLLLVLLPTVTGLALLLARAPSSRWRFGFARGGIVLATLATIGVPGSIGAVTGLDWLHAALLTVSAPLVLTALWLPATIRLVRSRVEPLTGASGAEGLGAERLGAERLGAVSRVTALIATLLTTAGVALLNAPAWTLSIGLAGSAEQLDARTRFLQDGQSPEGLAAALGLLAGAAIGIAVLLRIRATRARVWTAPWLLAAIIVAADAAAWQLPLPVAGVLVLAAIATGILILLRRSTEPADAARRAVLWLGFGFTLVQLLMLSLVHPLLASLAWAAVVGLLLLARGAVTGAADTAAVPAVGPSPGAASRLARAGLLAAGTLLFLLASATLPQQWNLLTGVEVRLRGDQTLLAAVVLIVAASAALPPRQLSRDDRAVLLALGTLPAVLLALVQLLAVGESARQPDPVLWLWPVLWSGLLAGIVTVVVFLRRPPAAPDRDEAGLRGTAWPSSWALAVAPVLWWAALAPPLARLIVSTELAGIAAVVAAGGAVAAAGGTAGLLLRRRGGGLPLGLLEAGTAAVAVAVLLVSVVAVVFRAPQNWPLGDAVLFAAGQLGLLAAFLQLRQGSRSLPLRIAAAAAAPLALWTTFHFVYVTGRTSGGGHPWFVEDVVPGLVAGLAGVIAVALATALGAGRVLARGERLAAELSGVVLLVPSLFAAEGHALGWVFVIGALLATLAVPPRDGSDRLGGRLLLGGLAAYALWSVVLGRPEWVEQVTVPLALALLVVGLVRLHREPDSRSWRRLAPGLAVLLAPSLLVELFGPIRQEQLTELLVRIVALGLVTVAVLVWGLLVRLQAPFLLGAIATVAHTLLTIRIVLRLTEREIPWWLWLAVAGAVLLALAIRYEAVRRDTGKTLSRLAAMR